MGFWVAITYKEPLWDQDERPFPKEQVPSDPVTETVDTRVVRDNGADRDKLSLEYVTREILSV